MRPCQFRVACATLAFSILFAFGAGPVSAKTVQLESGGSLVVGAGHQVITDRRTLDEISYQNGGASDPTLEAYWDRGASSVYLNHHAEGFVRMDDWDELDVDELWDSYIEGAKEQSEWLGVQVVPLRWIIEPTLNRQAATAYYALEVQFGNERPLVNMVIFDFGRFGYEELTLVQNSSDFPVNDAGGIAKEIAWAHKFGKEKRYRDFQQGDKIAAVGAAGLVAAALGARLNKGFMKLAFAIFKKGGFLILLLPFLAIRYFFGSGSDEE